MFAPQQGPLFHRFSKKQLMFRWTYAIFISSKLQIAAGNFQSRNQKALNHVIKGLPNNEQMLAMIHGMSNATGNHERTVSKLV